MFLVVIHELGHFIAAKKSGVKVLEFGIGIPPKAFKLWTDKSGTEYTVNRIPLG
jgi:regulator of sigma E protease